MKKTLRLKCLFLLLALSCFAQSAFASHLRGISLTWAPTSTPGTVQFTLLYSYRASNGCNPHVPCQVGDTASAYIDFGDGDQEPETVTVTSVNSSDDYMVSVGTFTHAYSCVGPYTAEYSDCCRLSNLKSGANGNLILQTTVTPFSTNHPPISSMPAILAVQLANTTSFQIAATDPDGDTLSYRLATAQEMYGASSFSCAQQQPPGLSVAQSGIVTWDTTQITSAGCGYAPPEAGDIWPAKFMISDLDSGGNVKSTIAVDILVKFITSTQAIPTLNFSVSGPITAAAGSPISFTATGDDTTANSRVMLNVSGMPVGATATNVNQLLTPPTQSVFSWTPTIAQAGTYVLTYTATTDTYLQVLGSVTINVTAAQPPVVTCSSTLAGQYGLPLSVPITVTDPRGEAVSVVWNVDSASAHTDSLSPSSSASSLSYAPTFTTVGAHTVSISATNTDGQTGTCTTSITINQANQTITFAPLPNLVYGAATSIALNATGGASNNPVVFTVSSGSATVSGSTLSIGAAGTIVVSANQAGSTNYSAAMQAQQTLVVSKASSSLAGPATQPVFVINGRSATLPVSITGQYTGTSITAPSGAISYTITNSSGSVVGGSNAQIANSAASIPVPSTRAPGNYTVSASYAGDGNYNAAAAVTIQLQVGQLQPVIHWSPPSSITYGATLSSVLSAQAFNGTSTVAGSYSYTIAGKAVSPSTILGVGSYSVTVAFTPTDTTTYKSATSTVSLVVNKVTVGGVTLASSVPSILVQNSVTLTATVVSPISTPTGTITYLDGSNAIGTANLVNGTATLSVNSLTVGTHTLSAVYSGDANFLTASSATTPEVVEDFTVTVSSQSSQIILPGATATYDLVVTPVGGATLPSAISLSVTGLPSNAAYTITPQTVTSGSSTTAAILTVSAAPQTAGWSADKKLAPIAFALLLLPFSRRRHKASHMLGRFAAVLLMAVGSAGILMAITGCGISNGFFAQPQKTYTVTVAGTSGSLQHSTNLTLTVQ